MFEVKKAADIPVDKNTAVGKRTEFPFADMEVGDAFLVPADHRGAEKVGAGGSRVGSAANYWRRRYGAKFATNRQKDGSIRVERIA